MNLQATTLYFVLLTTAATVKLPSSFMQCDRKQPNFQTCLTEAIENAIHQMNKPFKEVDLTSLEPVKVPSLTFEEGTSVVGFRQHYQNLKLSGLTKIKCFNTLMDFATKVLKINCTVPLFTLDFNYNIRGKLLMMPVYGDGPGNITYHDLNFLFAVNLAEYEKHGEKYFKVLNQNTTMEPKLVRFLIDNLFDGDKAMGDNIIRVLNENWREISDEMGTSYAEAFGKVFAAIFDRLLAKVPVKDLFGVE